MSCSLNYAGFNIPSLQAFGFVYLSEEGRIKMHDRQFLLIQGSIYVPFVGTIVAIWEIVIAIKMNVLELFFTELKKGVAEVHKNFVDKESHDKQSNQIPLSRGSFIRGAIGLIPVVGTSLLLVDIIVSVGRILQAAVC